MIGEFIHYYPAYTVESVLNMYAVTFFTMLATMYRLKGMDKQESAYNTAIAFSGGDGLAKYLEENAKQIKGAKGLLEEVRIARKYRKSK